METKFILNVDKNGRPCIKFKHYDRSNTLEQKILDIFIKAVKKHGCVLVNPGGFLEAGTDNSYENYEIQIAKH